MLRRGNPGKPLIEIQDLVYEYPSGRALDGVGCRIAPGTITALVGPNGAGKTTLIRCIVGLAAPFSGTVLFEGRDVYRDPRAAHRRMGYLSDFFGVYEELTARQCLTYMARAYEVPAANEKAAISQAAASLGISDLLDRPAGQLSRGQRQRLAIAQSILHQPSFLVLDEPASGLDPGARHEFSRFLMGLRDAGMTILVSSHILAELEDYCSDMLVMREGRIVGHEMLAAGAAVEAIRMRLDLAATADGLAAMLAGFEGVSNPEVAETSATFDFRGDAAARARFLRGLVEAGVAVSGFAAAPRHLQTAYFAALEGDGGKTP